MPARAARSWRARVRRSSSAPATPTRTSCSSARRRGRRRTRAGSRSWGSRQAARRVARRGRAGEDRRLYCECLEMQASWQQGPAAGRDRQLPALPDAPGRADPAAGHLHAGQLRDEAAARRAGRHLQAAWPGRDHHDRQPRGAAVPALPSGRRAVYARAARDAARGRRAAAGAPGDGFARPARAATAGARPRAPRVRLRRRVRAAGAGSGATATAEPAAAAQTGEPERPDWARSAEDEPGDQQLGLF